MPRIQPSPWTNPATEKIFGEPPDLEGALGLALKVDRVLHHARTKYQELHVV